MKKILIPISALLVSGFAEAQVSPTENYVQSKTYLDYNGTTPSKTAETVQYFDGLGRPKQVVNVKASPLGRDVVTPIEYDGFGRQVKDYLPIPQGNTLNGAIVPTPLGNSSTIYGGEKIYAEKVLENSPLDRIQQQIQVGNDWSTKPVKFDYDANINADYVRKYETSTTWVEGRTQTTVQLLQYFSPNQLYKNTLIDEDGNKTIEFKNGKGQTLLVRKALNSTENADTYYVYNEYDQLAFVIPPLASAPKVEDSTMDNLYYQYRYDGRNRLVEKKVPGKGWEHMVYDKADRLIMTQDAEMKLSGKWLFTKYDQFSRVIYTGIASIGNFSRDQVQSSVYQYLNQGQPATESRNTTGFANSGMTVNYSNNVYPKTIDKVLTINYYDAYFTGDPFPDKVWNQDVLPSSPQQYDRSTKGLPVIKLVKNIEDDGWTKTYFYYDLKGRPIREYILNHLGGYTNVERQLDFSGNIKVVSTQHKRLATDAEKLITESFEYDHQNRLLTHFHKVDDHPAEILTQNKYNELSQLETKKVGGTSVASPLQSIDYAYNIRGWMTSMNNPDNLGTDLFGYKINYTQVEGLETPNQDYVNLKVKPKYNGNISEVSWKTLTENNEPLKRYGYVYDPLNRLSAGFYQKSGSENAQEYFEKLDYDVNGNITRLKRSAGALPGTTVATVIDNLKYDYLGNRLSTVKDEQQNPSGYPYLATPNAIGYDLNGNMTDHLDKEISAIKYNYLNLPKQITQSSKVTSYTYRADGVKVKKLFGDLETDYLDGFQYKSTKPSEANSGGGFVIVDPNEVAVMKLRIIPTSEGYYDALIGQYIYNFTDHLGNVRLSYTDTNKDGIIQPRQYRVQQCDVPTNPFNIPNCIDIWKPGEIVEINNYYPFGMLHNYTATTQNAYQYKYNGKELQETGMYDYGARFYMPDIGRWGVVDPLAEKFFDFTGYNYVLNNPIKFVDKDGMDVYLLNEEGKFILAKKQKGDDLVYGYNSKTGKLNDNNGDKKGDYKDGIRIKTKGLVGQLQYYRDGSKEDNYPAYHQSIKEYSSQVEDDMFNLFQYAANNAKNVEFSLIDFNKGEKRYLALQTYNDSGFSPGSGQIGKDISTNAEYHNHPFKTIYDENYTELNSMGSRGQGIYYGQGGDYRNTVNYNVNYPNYVFFPKSTNLYNVTKTGVYLIQKINSESKNFKKK